MVCVVALLVVSAVVEGQDVKTNYMPGTNFAKYHTYKWISIKGVAHPNQIVDAPNQVGGGLTIGGEGYDQN